jgi:rhodanese-related sulfurtransferase
MLAGSASVAALLAAALLACAALLALKGRRVVTRSVLDWNAAVSLGPLYDVRSAAEYAAGHIPGSVNLPLSEIQSRIHQLNVVLGGRVALVCKSYVRARLAAQIIDQMASCPNIRSPISGMTTGLVGGFVVMACAQVGAEAATLDGGGGRRRPRRLSRWPRWAS